LTKDWTPVERVLFARIDLEPRGGGDSAEVVICPYAVIVKKKDGTRAENVTGDFGGVNQRRSELKTLAALAPGTEISRQIVGVIGRGCERLAGPSIARLRMVSEIALALPGEGERPYLPTAFTDGAF
jgi:hypothetical protein